MKPILVLCLGNEVLSDDAFGFRVGEALAGTTVVDSADVVPAALAGFALLDIMEGREAVLVVDTVLSGNAPPGELHFYPRGHWTPSRGLAFSHQINLPTALRFGQLLGYDMPERIDVLAVEADDVCTLSEQMTPAVTAAVPEAAAIIEQWVLDRSLEVENGHREQKDAVA